jgi:tRNA A-37 threonylcarbamoyl transferase component Bud32
VKEIHVKVDKLNKHYILHKDPHGDNIIVVKKGDKYIPMLIDFGNAVYAKDKDLPTVDDPHDINHGIDKKQDLANKLVFKLLDDNMLKIK